MKKIIYNKYRIEITKVKKKDKVTIYDAKADLTNEQAVKIMRYLFLEGFINSSVAVCEIIVG